MKIKNYIILGLIALFLFSCTDSFVYNTSQRKLINNSWQINTYIDYSQNNTSDIAQATYKFDKTGVLTKIYLNNDTVIANWEMSLDGKYLTLGSNIFRIMELTNKVMALRYGEVEMFFTVKD